MKLKKCPFCGAETSALNQNTVNDVVTVFVECESCGAKGPACSMADAKKTAARAWNGAFMRHNY